MLVRRGSGKSARRIADESAERLRRGAKVSVSQGFVSFPAAASGGCCGPGNEVLVSSIQRGVGEGTPGAAIIMPTSPVQLARPVGSRGGRDRFGASSRAR